MATAIQFRRGTTAQHANFTGLTGEITVDTDLKTIRVHDGSTAAGTRLATFAEIQALDSGVISAVAAGNGLTGGGESGNVTLTVGAGDGITVNTDNVAVNTAYYDITNGGSGWAGNLEPSTNNTFSLGSETNVWKDLYVGPTSIRIGGVALSLANGILQFGGANVAVAGSASSDADTRGLFSVTDTGGDGSLSYNNTTGVITYTGPDQSEANTRIDARLSGGTGVTYTNGSISIGQAVGTGDSVTFAGITGPLTGNVTGTVSSIANHSTTNLAEGTNLYFTAARARGNVSATTASGISYDSGTGVFSLSSIPNSSLTNSSITINGTAVALGGTRTLSTTDVAEGTNLYFTTDRANTAIDAKLSGGTGVTYTSGVISIGQAVGTTSEVSFAKITTTSDVVVGGNLTVQGTQVILNTTTVETEDTIFRVNSGGATGANVGFEANVGGNIKQIVYTTADKWSIGAETLVADTFEGNLAGNVTGDVTGTVSSIANHSTTNLAEGTNLYFTTARANSAMDAYLVGGNGLTYTSGNLNVGAGAGITVNADNVALTSGIVTAAAQSGGISAITVDTFGRVTSVTANAGFTTNTGTVTSVGGTGTVSGLTLTGTVTTSGSLTLGGTLAVAASDFASQTTKTFLAAPNAANGVPTFRTILVSDVPTLNQNTTGTAAGLSATLAVASGGTGVTTSTGTGSVVLSSSPTLVTPALGTPSSATLTNATGLPIVAGTTGTLSVARGGTGVTTSTGTGAVVLGTSPTFTTQISVPSIVKTGTSGTGNIGQSANTFNTVFAKATSAQYADLAERYEADTILDPGTVVCFGGDKEITVCGHENHHAVVGVISTDPAYMMNSGAGNDSTHPYVALTGRVPCKVDGPVNPGDLMVASAVSGHAMANNNARAGTIIGKAIGKNQDGPGVIEVLITLM